MYHTGSASNPGLANLTTPAGLGGQLHTSLNPPLRFPKHVHLSCAGKLTLVADLGRFVLESDRDTASSLPLEEASLYECVKLSGSNISAYLVDGDFSFAALEHLGSQKAAAPQEEEEPRAGAEAGDPPSVSTDMTAALTQSQGKALGGSAVFIPLLERCGTSASLQAARFPHPSLPPVKLQLQVPKLRFFFSPARLGRILRAVDAVMPGALHQLPCIIYPHPLHHPPPPIASSTPTHCII